MYGGDTAPHQPGRPGRKKGSKALRPAMFLDLGDRKTKWRGEGGASGALFIRKERKLARRLLTGWRAQINGGYDFQFFDSEKLDALDAIQTKWAEYLLRKRQEKQERRQKERELQQQQEQQQHQQQQQTEEEPNAQGGSDDPRPEKKQKIDAREVLQQLLTETGEETQKVAAEQIPPAAAPGVDSLLQGMQQRQQRALLSLLEG